MTRLITPTPEAIIKAADLLRAGELLGLPTETVYGLAADATNDQAVAKIYTAKGRPSFNPLICHLSDAHEAERYVTLNHRAKLVMDAFWPGPLTIILPLLPNAGISPLATAGLETLALRVPSHPVAKAVIAALGRPVAAPSANKSGKVSATTPEHVAQHFGDEVPLTIAAGRCTVGLESTVLDLSGSTPNLLRPGAILREEIAAVLGESVFIASDDPNAPKSPGQLLQHYAPNLPVRLNALEAQATEILLTFGPDFAVRGGATRLALSDAGDLVEAARNLFLYLRQADNADYSGIAVMPIPTTGLGAAINDRLQRAATR